MATIRTRYRLKWEGLEERLALSTAHPLHVSTSVQVHSVESSSATAVPVGDTISLLDAFARTYLTRAGQANYNPAFDLNHNGQIGQDDARLLLHSLPPVSRAIPLTISVTLAPQDKARGHVPQNSGGVTHSQNPTILGHTTPGALIFTGTGTVDLKLRGPVLVADAHGNFSYKNHLTAGINQLDFQAVDPYGHQLLRAFPIYWLDFGK
jgi:hypothetical protein